MSKYTARDQAVRAFGKSLIGPLKSEMSSLKIKRHTGQMFRVRDRYYKYHGRITGFGFVIPRHAVFVHKGVGRGYPIETAGAAAFGQTRSRKVRALKAKGFNQKYIAKALSNSDKLQGKMRRPKPWFNPVVDRALPKLAEDLATHNADLLAENILIL